MGGTFSTHKMSVVKPQGKMPLGKNKSSRQEDNNKMNLREKACECVDWIVLVKDKVKWRAFRKRSKQQIISPAA
jgi:hypothetical protein